MFGLQYYCLFTRRLDILGGRMMEEKDGPPAGGAKTLRAHIALRVHLCTSRRSRAREAASLDRRAWGFALSLLLAFNILSSLRHQLGLYADYQWRIPAPKQIYDAGPAIEEDDVRSLLCGDGYHSRLDRLGAVRFSSTSHDALFAVTAANGGRWRRRPGMNRPSLQP